MIIEHSVPKGSKREWVYTQGRGSTRVATLPSSPSPLPFSSPLEIPPHFEQPSKLNGGKGEEFDPWNRDARLSSPCASAHPPLNHPSSFLFFFFFPPSRQRVRAREGWFEVESRDRWLRVFFFDCLASFFFFFFFRGQSTNPRSFLWSSPSCFPRREQSLSEYHLLPVIFFSSLSNFAWILKSRTWLPLILSLMSKMYLCLRIIRESSGLFFFF